jgi:hypothetical protein
MLHQFGYLSSTIIGQIAAIIQNHIKWAISTTKNKGLFDAPIRFFDTLTFPGKKRQYPKQRSQLQL